MTIKKTAAKAISPKSANIIPAAFQRTGLRSVRKVYGTDIAEIRGPHATKRQVALAFGEEGQPTTKIYMDELLTVIRRREQRTFVVRTPAKKAVVKKAAKKDLTKKAVDSSNRAKRSDFLTVQGESRGSVFRSDTAATNAIKAKVEKGYLVELQSEKAIVPQSIKKFTLYFFLNIRKLVCPRAGAKPTLSAGGSGMVGGLAILIAGHFGVVADVAKAIASAVLILIVSATKGAFCDMTAEMAKAAIKNA